MNVNNNNNSVNANYSVDEPDNHGAPDVRQGELVLSSGTSKAVSPSTSSPSYTQDQIAVVEKVFNEFIEESKFVTSETPVNENNNQPGYVRSIYNKGVSYLPGRKDIGQAMGSQVASTHSAPLANSLIKFVGNNLGAGTVLTTGAQLFFTGAASKLLGAAMVSLGGGAVVYGPAVIALGIDFARNGYRFNTPIQDNSVAKTIESSSKKFGNLIKSFAQSDQIIDAQGRKLGVDDRMAILERVSKFNVLVNLMGVLDEVKYEEDGGVRSAAIRTFVESSFLRTEEGNYLGYDGKFLTDEEMQKVDAGIKEISRISPGIEWKKRVKRLIVLMAKHNVKPLTQMSKKQIATTKYFQEIGENSTRRKTQVALEESLFGKLENAQEQKIVPLKVTPFIIRAEDGKYYLTERMKHYPKGAELTLQQVIRLSASEGLDSSLKIEDVSREQVEGNSREIVEFVSSEEVESEDILKDVVAAVSEVEIEDVLKEEIEDVLKEEIEDDSRSSFNKPEVKIKDSDSSSSEKGWASSQFRAIINMIWSTPANQANQIDEELPTLNEKEIIHGEEPQQGIAEQNPNNNSVSNNNE